MKLHKERPDIALLQLCLPPRSLKPVGHDPVISRWILNASCSVPSTCCALCLNCATWSALQSQSASLSNPGAHVHGVAHSLLFLPKNPTPLTEDTEIHVPAKVLFIVRGHFKQEIAFVFGNKLVMYELWSKESPYRQQKSTKNSFWDHLFTKKLNVFFEMPIALGWGQILWDCSPGMLCRDRLTLRLHPLCPWVVKGVAADCPPLSPTPFQGW